MELDENTLLLKHSVSGVLALVKSSVFSFKKSKWDSVYNPRGYYDPEMREISDVICMHVKRLET